MTHTHRLLALLISASALALSACSSTPTQVASAANTCRVYDAQTSMALQSGKVAVGERKAGDARALSTLQRMRGHVGAGSTLIDDLLRECS